MATWTRALVTGASSGIGEQFARTLAAGGSDLVIVARRAERLEKLAAELRDEHGRTVEILTADLADPDGLRTVEERAAAATDPIDLLVNNAGFGTTGTFAGLDVEREDEEVRTNCIALMRLTRAALPGMLERNRGGILNVGSIAGFQPAPKSATYCATKAFVMTFSESLHGELKGTPVKVSVLCPGLTRTEFQDTAAYDASTAPDFLWQTAEEVVDVALAGLAKNKAVIVPGALNRSVAAFSSAAPRGVVRRVAAIVQSRQKADVA